MNDSYYKISLHNFFNQIQCYQFKLFILQTYNKILKIILQNHIQNYSLIIRMIIFLIAIFVLIFAILVNFLQPFKKNRILLMSILAILMIMINFINQIDIILSPPQLIVRQNVSKNKQASKKLIKLNFKQQYEDKSMQFLQAQLEQIKSQTQKQLKAYQAQQDDSNANKSQKQLLQKSLSLISQLPPKEHYKPLIKQQKNLLQQLRKKVIDKEDWIISVENINKIRFQLLINKFVKDLNDKKQTYQIKFQQILYAPLYLKQSPQTSKYSNSYILSQNSFSSLQQNNYYFLILYNKPSDYLLQYLHKNYIEKNKIYLTIIFLDLNQDFKAFPISSYVQSLQFQQQVDYQQPIHQFLSKIKPQKQTQTLKELQNCAKYVQLDYDFFLRLIVNINRKSLAEICYKEALSYHASQQVKCLQSLVKDQSQLISYQKAFQCWKGNPSSNYILHKNNKIKLKKSTFWANKLNESNFGLSHKHSSKNCSNQL